MISIYMLSKELKQKLNQILSSDIGKGDITSSLLEPAKCKAEIVCNENCVIAGLEEAKFLFNSKNVDAESKFKDGQFVKKNSIVLKLNGLNKSILSIERTVLNVLGRMSGVATNCRKAKDLVVKKKPQISLTRKTLPGFNDFDKKAAKTAGCWSHRKNLGEAVLIKENHLEFFKNPREAVELAGKKFSKKRNLKNFFIEIEARNLKEAVSAAKSSPDIILLDNFSPAKAKKAISEIKKINAKIKIELSGGINFSNLKNFAKLNAGIISMGCLTREAKMVDFNLNVKT